MKPNQTEDEYIWAQEMRLRMEKLAQEQQSHSAAEKRRLKEAHWMHCPKCGQQLATETCGAVEIDVCPNCKGIWLDMGELGTILETTSQNNFFNKCLRVICKDKPASPHLASKAGPKR